MGKLADLLRGKLQTIRNERQAPAPNYRTNPDEAYEYMLRHNDLIYIEQQIPRVLLQELRKLSPEQQAEYYRKSISPEKAASMTLDQFLARLSDPKNDSAWILNDSIFGKSEDELIQNLESVMRPEEIDAASNAVNEIRSPRDPEFPEELKYQPASDVREDLQAVRQIVPADDPGREDTMNMLQQVESELSVVNAEVMEFYNQMDNETDGLPSLSNQMDQISYDNVNNFIDTDTTLGLSGKLSRNYNNNYVVQSLQPDPETLNKVQSLTTGVPDDVKSRIREMEQHFNAIGEEKLQNSNSVSRIAPSSSGVKKAFYLGEQGTKMYAFWPLIQAKRNLKQAVKNRNLSEIKNAHNAYAGLHQTYQEMIKTVEKTPNVYCGNLNSTRPSVHEEPNLMPDEFVRDYAGHNKVNGLFLLHGISKNLGVSAAEFAEKPIECMKNGAHKYINDMGLNANRSLASKLVRGLSNTACDHFESGWDLNRGLCNRSLMSVSGLCKPGSPEAKRLNIQGELASTVSKMEVDKEVDLWGSLARINEKKRDIFYRHAALLPGDLFNLKEMAEKLQLPNWKDELNPDKVINVLRSEKMIDYAELTKRTKQVMDESDHETFFDKLGQEQNYQSGFDKNRYLESAHRAYLDLIRTAPPEEQEREDFKVFKKHVLSMSKLTEDLETKDLLARREFEAGLITEHEMEMKLDQGSHAEDIINTPRTSSAITAMGRLRHKLTQKKEGFFISSTDSKEHQAMTSAVELFRYKLSVVKGIMTIDQVADEKLRKQISQISLKEAAVKAWSATYAYINKSDEYGKKTEWSYPAGKIRNQAAKDTLKQIQAVSDELGLVTPAAREMMKLRTTLHNNRNNEDWMDQHLEAAVAKNMYLMTMYYKKIPPEKQEQLLESAVMKKNLKKIAKDPAFKRMIENEFDDDLAQKILEGKGGLSDTFIKAKKKIIAEQQLEDTLANVNVKKLNSKTRGEFWAKQTIDEPRLI